MAVGSREKKWTAWHVKKVGSHFSKRPKIVCASCEKQAKANITFHHDVPPSLRSMDLQREDAVPTTQRPPPNTSMG